MRAHEGHRSFSGIRFRKSAWHFARRKSLCLFYGTLRRCCGLPFVILSTLLPRHSVGLGAPKTVIGYVSLLSLSRCRLVGSCVRSDDNRFSKLYRHVCTFDPISENLAVNRVFIIIRSTRDMSKFHFFLNFSKVFLLFPLP